MTGSIWKPQRRGSGRMLMLLWTMSLLLSEGIIFPECHGVHHAVKTPAAASPGCHTSSPSLSCLQEPSITFPLRIAHLFCHLYNLTRLFQSFSAEVAMLLTHCLLTENFTWGQHHPKVPSHPSSPSSPRSSSQKQATPMWGQTTGFAPCTGKVI